MVLTGPTILTVFRIILSIAFFVFVLFPWQWAKIVACVLFVSAAITDLIDGKWARRNQLVTDLGAFLDPLADKILVNLSLLALVSLDVIPIWAFAVILVRDFIVDGVRMAVARKGETVSASLLGKLKTATQMIALSILILNLTIEFEPLLVIGTTIFYFALGLTVLSGINYLIKERKRLIK